MEREARGCPGFLRCEERPHAQQVVSNCSNLESVSPGKRWTLRLSDAVPSPRSFDFIWSVF